MQNCENLFFRTLSLFQKEKLPKVKYDVQTFISFMKMNSWDFILEQVFLFEMERFFISQTLPLHNTYLENRANKINDFETLVKENKILETIYTFNIDSKILNSKVNCDLINFSRNNIKSSSDQEYSFLLRRSLTHKTGVFEKLLTGWDLLILDIKKGGHSFTGEELINTLRQSYISKDLEIETVKFLSNHVVYYDTLNFIK